MALMDWLRKKLTHDKIEAIAPASGTEEILSGLDVKQVLDAHSAWKNRLQDALDGTSSEELDVSIISQDSFCALGKWIYSAGKDSYSHLPEYESLRSAHAHFHLCAGEVLTEHQDGNLASAAQLLKTKFRTASNKNQLELVRLFTAARR